MKALISDIHGNFEALCAVCADMDKHTVDQIVCLGDIVGYGADPEACTDFVMQKAAVTLMGNHDYALVNGAQHFNPTAAQIIEITRGRMQPPGEADAPDAFEPAFLTCPHEKERACSILKHDRLSRWHFLEGLSLTQSSGKNLFVHGSPLDPIYEYIFPDRFARTWDTERLGRMFGFTEWFVFCGHTHMPCAISSEFTCSYPEHTGYRLVPKPGAKYIVNVGSVGQPRDGDKRACYALFDEELGTVEWRRVEYDIDAAVKKIESAYGDDNWSAARLQLGR